MLLMVDESSTTLMATWLTPEPANGVISSYTIACNSIEDPVLMVRFDISAFNTSTLLTGLQPFTEYQCVISASTGAGEGTASAPQTATTDEAGENDGPGLTIS